MLDNPRTIGRMRRFLKAANVGVFHTRSAIGLWVSSLSFGNSSAFYLEQSPLSDTLGVTYHQHHFQICDLDIRCHCGACTCVDAEGVLIASADLC